MGSRSFDQFKAALNGIVTRPNPRVRHNMAIRQLPSGEIQFDTVEEMIAYQRAMGGAGGAGAPAGSQPPRGAKPVDKPMEASAPRRRKFSGKPVREGAISWAQADRIGKAIGGIESYCPQLKNVLIEGGTHVHALTKLGVDRPGASRAIDRMIAEGADFHYSDFKLPKAERDAKIALARKILEEECNVSCQVASTFTYPNPRPTETMAQFKARVRRLTGIPFDQIPWGERDDVHRGPLVARRGNLYVVPVDHYPEIGEDGQEVFREFRKVQL